MLVSRTAVQNLVWAGLGHWVRAELGFFNVDFENIIPRLPPRSGRTAPSASATGWRRVQSSMFKVA